LSWNNIGESGAEALGRLLASSNALRLEHLELECNNLGNIGVAKLLSALFAKGNNQEFQGATLCSLGLASNNITSDGASHLAAGLKEARVLGRLESLELGRNRLGPSGAQHLCEALKSPGLSLQRLGLCTTRIQNSGAVALARSISARRGLRETSNLCWPSFALSLRSNLLGDNAAVALADAVIAGELQELFLEFNKIGGAGVEALENAVKHPGLAWKPFLGLDENSSQFSPQSTAKVNGAQQGLAGYTASSTRKRRFEH
jgi:Ran GTPase-activating protein (RanGAP) involved in mRNA processing and transport